MEIRLAHNDKINTFMSKSKTKIKQYLLSITVDN